MQYFVPSDAAAPLRILAEAFPPGTAVPLSVARQAKSSSKKWLPEVKLPEGEVRSGSFLYGSASIEL